MECLSGYALSDVRVYRESPWPARIGARAFVLGSDIHLSPGAEDALAHELWHVVQQKQGRVRANRILDFGEPRLGGVGLNDDEALEREADAKARLVRSLVRDGVPIPEREALWEVTIRRPVVQRAITITRGAITGQQVTVNAAGARTRLSAMYQMTAGNTHDLAQVTTDIDNANMTFADWPAFKSEVKRRSFGSAHAAAMVALRQADQPLRTNWINALPPSKRNSPYKVNSEIRKWEDRIGAAGMANQPTFIYWGAKIEYNLLETKLRQRDKPFFRWLTGATPAAVQMNCWEAVIYAGAQGAGALWTRDYVFWACQRRLLGGTVVPLFVDSIVNNAALHTVAAPNAVTAIPNGVLRGMVAVFSRGAHVALTTGNIVPIVSQSARAVFGNNGNEIVDLDGGSQGLRLTTLEETIADAPPYSGELHLGWMPDVPANVNVVINNQLVNPVAPLHQAAVPATHFYE